MRDSLNRNKENRNRFRYSEEYRRSNNIDYLCRQGSDKRPSDVRELVSPASSGDEKEMTFNSKKGVIPPTAVKLINSAAIDSGLSEDHGSTGSAASSGGHPSDDLVGHQRAVGSLHHNHHHRKMLSIKVDSVVNASSKIRRPSSDSARSSHHDDLELVSPREIPLYRRNKSPDDLSSSSYDKHDALPFVNRVAGADDVSDGSRPGTPLCDERPEHLTHESAPVRLSSHLRSTEPMSLPLPGFAAQVKSTSPKATLPTGGVHPLANATPVTVPCKKDRDPRLKSPTTPTSHQIICLKSPPPSLKSPPGKLFTDKCPSIVVSPAFHELGAKPHDPRLGLLQLAPAPVHTPKSPPPQPPPLSLHLDNDMEDISDSEKEPAEPADLTLEERLRALDEKYEKWSGSTKHAPAVATTPIGSSTPSAAMTPTTISTPLITSAPISASLSSACTSATSSTSSAAASSASANSASFKFNFDLKSSQPSAIVQRLLSRKSVFDEDSKRLESITEVYDTSVCEGEGNKSKNVSVGSVNFSAGYNTISTLSDKPLPTGTPASSSPASPAAFASSLPKDIPTMPLTEDLVPTPPPSNTIPVVNSYSSSNSKSAASSLPSGLLATAIPTTTSAFATGNIVSTPVPVKTTFAGTPSLTTVSVSEKPQMTAALAGTQHTTATLVATAAKISSAALVTPTATPKSTSSAVVGQVKPVTNSHRTAPLPSVVGASTTTTPIKPLVDGKVRPMVSNKPSATVTPTFKSINQTSSVQANSGSRKSTSLSTTVSTKTSCSATAAATTSAAVEKGEASSTTSSPKTELVLSCGKVVTNKTAISPVSSSHVEVVVSSTIFPPHGEEDGGVSSTTKELDLKSSNRDPLKTLKKEVLDPFSLVTNAKEVKLLEKSELFAPLLIHKQPKDKKLKENKKQESSSVSVSKESSNKHSSSSSSKDKDRKTSHRDMQKKLKEKMKDRELKNFLSATDTIPNHVSKKESKQQHPSTPFPKDISTPTTVNSVSLTNDVVVVKKDKESSSSKEKENPKRRLSQNVSECEEAPKAKQPKLKTDDIGEPDLKKVKTEKESSLDANSKMGKMGRIPKIKQEGTSSSKHHSSESSKPKEDKEKEKSRSSEDKQQRTEEKSSSKSSSKSHKHEDRNKRLSDDKRSTSGSTNRERERERSSKSSKDIFGKSSLTKSESSSKKRSRHSSDEDLGSSSRKKERHSSSKRKSSKDKEDRRKSTSSQTSNTSTTKKRVPNNSDTDVSVDSDGNEPKKFSIFDEPIFDAENPIYFSMYDKVKARRSCNANKEKMIENQRRQQEAIWAKFSKLKQKRAEKNKKRREGGEDFDDKDDVTDTDEEEERSVAAKLSAHKKKHSLITRYSRVF